MTTTEFNGRPFVAGSLTGLRSFRIDALGRLTGVTYPKVFKPGENVGHCAAGGEMQMSLSRAIIRNFYWSIGEARVASNPSDAPVSLVKQPKHRVGQLDCGCGYYAYFDRGNNPHHQAGQVLGVIEGYGVTTVGSRGFRAEKARLLALIHPRRSGWPLDRIAARFNPDSIVSPLALTGGVLGVAWTIYAAVVAIGAFGLVALPTVLAPLLSGLLGYLPIRGIYVDEAAKRAQLALLRRNYPDVPVYRTVRAALRAHPLTPPPEPPAPTPQTDPQFWTREATA